MKAATADAIRARATADYLADVVCNRPQIGVVELRLRFWHGVGRTSEGYSDAVKASFPEATVRAHGRAEPRGRRPGYFWVHITLPEEVS